MSDYNPSKIDKRIPSLIISVMLLTLFFLSYLALTSQTIIFHDSLSYQSIAEMFVKNKWLEYFITGPSREPLYSILVSLSMRLAQWQSVNYLSIQIILQMIILLISQYLTYRLLKKLQISDKICAVILAYMGVSPAMVSSGLILFSEILTYPIILWLILAVSKSWLQLKTCSRTQTILNALNFSIPALLIILIKGSFELIIPCILLPFFFLLLKALKEKNKLTARNAFIFLVAVTAMWYLPVAAYKFTNKHFNGLYVFTNRGSDALYGNTSRRMLPLSSQRLQSALAYMVGPDACSDLFKQNCVAWSHLPSDLIGQDKIHTLIKQGLSKSQINKTLIKETTPIALKNPFQYVFLSIIEGSKVLFWEAPEIAYVIYPDAIDKIYNASWFKYSLRCLVAFLSAGVLILGMLSIWRNKSKILNSNNISDEKYIYHCFICLLILTFTVIHSIFFILPRYALPIAPLFLTLIAWQFEMIARKKRQ